MKTHHATQASGRWYTLSLAEQMGNIGSEVHRAARAQGRDQESFDLAVERAFELLGLTLADSRRTMPQRKEVARTRELFADAALQGGEYTVSLQELDDYLLHYALKARRDT